jgi:hypothetical protein
VSLRPSVVAVPQPELGRRCMVNALALRHPRQLRTFAEPSCGPRCRNRLSIQGSRFNSLANRSRLAAYLPLREVIVFPLAVSSERTRTYGASDARDPKPDAYPELLHQPRPPKTLRSRVHPQILSCRAVSRSVAAMARRVAGRWRSGGPLRDATDSRPPKGPRQRVRSPASGSTGHKRPRPA